MPLKSRYNANFSGDVTYGNNVVESIIELAVQEISGVASLQRRGVKMDISGNIIDVDVFMNVYSSVRCNDVAFRVQESIKRSVETMTEFKVGIVNINVINVVFEENHDR